MTCTTERGGRSILTLEGRLTDRAVDELETFAAPLDMRGLTLNLAGVTFADARGVALLRALEQHGVVLADGSAFLAALMAGSPPCP